MTNRHLPALADTSRHLPVDVRLIGPDEAVRALVTALQQAAACGSVSYRPSRYGDGTRAYLSVVVPTAAGPGADHAR